MKRNGKKCQGCIFQGIEVFAAPDGDVQECYTLREKGEEHPEIKTVRIFSDEYVMCSPDTTCGKWEPAWESNWKYRKEAS